MTSNQREMMDDEEQRDALLFGQENPFENDEEKPTIEPKSKPSDPSSRMAMIAIAVATVLLTLMVVYRPDSVDERVNTLNQLLRVGTGDSKMASVLPPVTLPFAKAPPASVMTQSGIKTTDTTPGVYLSPPVPKSATNTGSNVMSSSYNNQAAIATTGTMSSSSVSTTTNTMQAGNIPSLSDRLLLSFSNLSLHLNLR